MVEIDDDQKQGAWRRESERLRVEVTQRFIRLRNEGIIPTAGQLDQWLRLLQKGLSVQLGHEQDEKGNFIR